MSRTITCPAVATITSVITAIDNCPFEIGQIQKLVFWRRGSELAAVASATSATVWTAHLAATGDEKLVVSPMCTCVIPQSEPREAGSGNEVIHGIPVVIGSGPVKAEGIFRQIDQDDIASIKAMQGEYLDVMFINESNQLIYKLNGSTVEGFPIRSLWVSDMGAGSFTDGVSNKFSFYLEPNWSDNARITTATTFLLDAINS
jgi:hypothetical protein